jgi:erythronate-4-phosphate dehydrogenase
MTTQTKIRLLADKHILLDANEFPPSISIELFNPYEGLPEDLTVYDALLVRTVTPLDKSTIPSNPGRLKFIGSATAGIDHANCSWLQKCGVEFAHSPGCNASSVGEYVSVAILAWSLITQSDLREINAGIIGAGHTGSAVEKLLSALNISYFLYDPPREQTEPTFKSASLEDILSCDILTFHTPLTRHGRWPTFHWLNRDKLSGRKFKLIINASRGGVIDEQDLRDEFQNGNINNYIFDAWENEPVFNDFSAKHALIRTPHIAGYSIQAKQRATQIVMDSLCTFFGIKSDGYRFTPVPPASPELSIAGEQPDLLSLLFKLNPIQEYNLRFEKLIGQPAAKKDELFQKLRTGFPLRHEHPYWKVEKALLEEYPVLYRLGFDSK